MIKFPTLIGMVSAVLMLQACNAGPNTPRPITNTPQPTTSPQSSVSERDSQYINLLQELSRRNPEVEAQQAIAAGDRSVMAYYAGRAGLKIPGFNGEEQAAQSCSLKTLDGLGDVIYGENHLKYRVALRNFARSFNTAMKPICL